MTQQCGKCKFWDRSNIKLVKPYNYRIADCLSTDNRADSYVDIESDGTLDKYPAIEQEGEDCPVYEERKECEE